MHQPAWFSALLDGLDHRMARLVGQNPPPGFPDSLSADAKAALLASYGTQFGAYVNLLWQVPALSLTAQAFLFTIALGDSRPVSRMVSGALSLVVAAMSIYLMVSHRIHAERHGRVATALAVQLGALDGADRTGAAGAWGAVNRGSFVLWIAGLALFGLVGFGAVLVGLVALVV